MGLVLPMIALASASERPRGSASLPRFARLASTPARLASVEISTTTVGRPSSVLPVSTIFTRGDLAASAR